MDTPIDRILTRIAEDHADEMAAESRFYREVSLARQAERLGIDDIDPDLRDTNAIVLLKEPIDGMKVRIDGRTFVDYAQTGRQVVVPGYVARKASGPFTAYTAEDSMVLVFA